MKRNICFNWSTNFSSHCTTTRIATLSGRESHWMRCSSSHKTVYGVSKPVRRGWWGPQCIEKGEFYGEELLEWGFNGSPSPKLSDFPISTKTVKTFTKVEAFALTANDLKILVARHSFARSNAKTKFTQAARRLLKEKKNEISIAEQY